MTRPLAILTFAIISLVAANASADEITVALVGGQLICGGTDAIPRLPLHPPQLGNQPLDLPVLSRPHPMLERVLAAPGLTLYCVRNLTALNLNTHVIQNV
jgi:hypothetical protein